MSSLPRIESEEDGRFYLYHGGQPDERKLRSVTAPLGRWDKDGLRIWAGLLAGQAAFEDLPALIAAATIEDCGRTYRRGCDEHGWDVSCPDCRCKRCEACLIRWMRDRHMAESKRRSDEGERVHGVVGHWAETGIWRQPETDIEPYIRTFRQFVAEYGLKPSDWELLEARVVNLTHGYAGTLDAAIHFHRGRSKATNDLLDRLTLDGQPRVEHALLLVDYKSREKPERQLYMDQPLQLAGYRFAETIVLRNGDELPMFQTDAAAIIQIRPDKTTLELVLAEEPEFATFLSLLAADEWALKRGKLAIGARTFSYAPSVVKLRAADARRRKKEQSLGLPGEPDTPNPPLNPELAPAQQAATVMPPEERGRRAAAAVGRPAAPALVELAASHGKAVAVPYASGVGAMADDLDIPF